MAEVAEWKALDPRELNQPSSEEVGGVSIRTYVSPYDVPETVGVSGSPDRKYYSVEFTYIGGQEETRPVDKEERIKLWLGRDSRRVYRIDFGVHEDEVEDRLNAVNEAIDELASEPHRPPRQGNYELVKKVLSSVFASPDSPLVKPA